MIIILIQFPNNRVSILKNSYWHVTVFFSIYFSSSSLMWCKKNKASKRDLIFSWSIPLHVLVFQQSSQHWSDLAQYCLGAGKVARRNISDSEWRDSLWSTRLVSIVSKPSSGLLFHKIFNIRSWGLEISKYRIFQHNC